MRKDVKKLRRARYWRKTMKNKLYAIALIGLGIVPILIEGDATLLVFAAFIAVPMFFSRNSWIA